MFVQRRYATSKSGAFKLLEKVARFYRPDFFSKNGVEIMADELATNRNNKNAFQ